MKLLHIAKLSGSAENGVNVVVPTHISEQSKYCEVKYVNYRNIDVAGLEGKRLPYERDFLHGLGNFRPDLAIIHEVNNFDNIYVYKQLLKAGIPYVILPHGEITNEALKKKWLKKKVAYFLFFNRFIKNAIAIQCLSEREMSAIKFKNRKFLGTNGVYIPEKRKTEYSDGSRKFLYIGRLDAYHKGLDLMIEGVSIAKGKGADVALDIYGPDYAGRAAHIRELIAKYNVGDSVRLHEAVHSKEKENLLLDCDVFIQTSRFEGMPLGILEALSYGLPCIVTRGTGLGEFVEKNSCGWVAETSPEGIAEKIIEAAGCHNAAEMGDNARKSVGEKYSWDMVVKTTIEEYGSLAGGNR